MIKYFQVDFSAFTSSKYVKSLLITSFVLFLTWSINPIFFETNDDTGIMAFVAGFKTGTPTPGTIFCNVIWGGGNFLFIPLKFIC